MANGNSKGEEEVSTSIKKGQYGKLEIPEQ